ncbi:unnamed protein product, partial [Rotaria magnacalcarata]
DQSPSKFPTIITAKMHTQMTQSPYPIVHQIDPIQYEACPLKYKMKLTE